MTADTAFFVQFPHPGGEHNPPIDDMRWNRGPHRRKFLITPGRYLNAEGRICDAELVFWGEWEPPSRVEQRWAASGRLPRALHRPYWVEPVTTEFRQNTDPWVFGERMLYSNCKQLSSQRRRNSMQRLTRASVVCFGSTTQGEFHVDTVFVVASCDQWTPAGACDLKVDDAFKTCTADSLATEEEDRHLPLTLYRGATLDDPVEGMFSFAPARRADADDPRFAQPRVELPDLINPSNRQSTWGSKRPLTTSQVREAWDKLRSQVMSADLVLAVRLQTPQCKTDDGGAP